MAKLRTDEQKKASSEKQVAKPAGAPTPAPVTETNERVGFLLQCPPGLAKVLQKELNYVGATTRDQKLFVKLQRNHDLLFLNHVKSDERLSELRCAEMVLRCPAYGRFKISQRQMSLMAEELKALGPRRLVVTVAGKQFQRQDLARFLTKAMHERDYDFDEDIEDEAWMFCIDESWYFGLPLFKAREMKHRNERAAEREGSLPPAIAAAMVFASVPKNDDVVLDPTCGSGTLLSEFRSYAPDATLIGRDIDAEAIRIARKNLNEVPSLLKPADLTEGDSRSSDGLPEGLTVTIANLPFGVQFGDRATNAALYRDLISSSLAKAADGWRGLFITSDTDSFVSAIREVAVSAPEIAFKVKIRGELATCYKVKRP